MADYKLSNVAKEDLIRIHHYGVKKFGQIQADKYLYSLFDAFELIAKQPYSFESVDFIKPGYRRCVCGVESIFFCINDGKIEIITIVGRQDINQIFNDI